MLSFLFALLHVSHAYLGLLTDGDILPSERVRAGVELQGVLNENDGINLAGHFDMGLNDSTELMLEAGTGAQDFFGSLQFKYVPYPDYENQPAIGFIFGTTVASESGDSDTLLSLKSFVSKKFETDIGPMTPYGALAVHFALTDNNDYDPLQLILGSKYKHPNWTNTHLLTEIGIDVSDAFNYIAVYLTYEFDKGSNPFQQNQSDY